MTRFADREKARTLRKEGKSYSEIKQILAIGKGTLSVWLRDMPLSKKQIRELRDVNPRRIESFRETMRQKREARLLAVYKKSKLDIKDLSRRELFLAGLYLYWGEGSKSSKGVVSVANTDPAMIKAFLDWLNYMCIPRSKLKVRLHLYEDMDEKKETVFWSKELNIPASQFRTPYRKNSRLVDITYKNGYGHGTCNLYFENTALWEYITMALKCIRELHRGA